MKRLSDTIDDTECGYCGKKELDLVHTSIAGTKINCLVVCQCRRKDVLVFKHDELGEVDEFEDAADDDQPQGKE